MGKSIRELLPEMPDRVQEQLIQVKLERGLVKKVKSKMAADKRSGKVATWKSLFTVSCEQYIEGR